MHSRQGTPLCQGEAERCGGTERRAEEAQATLFPPPPLSPPPSPAPHPSQAPSGRPLRHCPGAPGSRPAGPACGAWCWAPQRRGQLWRARDGMGIVGLMASGYRL